MLPALDHLRALLSQHSLSSVLIVAPTDLLYLTGLSLSRGRLFVTCDKAVLFVDPRYIGMAKTLPSDFEVQCHGSSSDMNAAMGTLFVRFADSIGFDGSTMTVNTFQELSSLSVPGQLVAAPALFAHLRRPKRFEELTAIQEACALCEQGFTYLLGQIHKGVTEQQLSGALKAFWFAHGAEALSFEPIIAFGPNSACPHWTSSSTALEEGFHILIDIGVRYHSYHSDMTRTIFFGRPDPEMLACHELVQKAYTLAFDGAKSGVLPITLDATARQYLTSQGYGEAFTHGLGHGVGLEVHESPRVSASAPTESPLELFDVITIEPGIYLEGRGGIRIENTIVIEEAGARSLFTLPIQPVFL